MGRRSAVVQSPKLPPTFTSLFHLFLRATSACVLHHNRSVRNLRRVWRPTFNVAATVVHQLQSAETPSEERKKLKSWLTCWDTRMDATLNLLYSSSQSRGLPHELTQNLSLSLGHYLKWTQQHYYSARETWKPQLDPSSPEYLPKPIVAPTLKAKRREEQKKRQNALDRNAWGALGEVVRMAEGRHRISLGRATFRERRA